MVDDILSSPKSDSYNVTYTISPPFMLNGMLFTRFAFSFAMITNNALKIVSLYGAMNILTKIAEPDTRYL
jgi:hypothetical protein